MAIKHISEIAAIPQERLLKASMSDKAKRVESWWRSLTPEQRKAYLAKHPKSKRAHTSVKPGIYKTKALPNKG